MKLDPHDPTQRDVQICINHTSKDGLPSVIGNSSGDYTRYDFLLFRVARAGYSSALYVEPSSKIRCRFVNVNFDRPTSENITLQRKCNPSAFLCDCRH